MIGVLEREGSHLTLNPSKVAGAILVNFCDKYFEREKKRIEADLFDKKSYLAWANKQANTPDEFIELVSKIDNQLRNQHLNQLYPPLSLVLIQNLLISCQPLFRIAPFTFFQYFLHDVASLRLF